MDQFIITGGVPLNGEVTPAGNKNAALPLMAACLLTDEPVILRNVPSIQDVAIMRALLESLGVEITALDDKTWKVQAKEVRPSDLDPDLTRKIRASILLAGPMTARTGSLAPASSRRRRYWTSPGRHPPPGSPGIRCRSLLRSLFPFQSERP